jgi:hypothetical protein
VLLEFDEALDVAVFSEYPDGDAPALYAAKHRFTGASTEVSVIVKERPVSVGVDPFLRRVELERTDNLLRLDAR